MICFVFVLFFSISVTAKVPLFDLKSSNARMNAYTHTHTYTRTQALTICRQQVHRSRPSHDWYPPIRTTESQYQFRFYDGTSDSPSIRWELGATAYWYLYPECGGDGKWSERGGGGRRGFQVLLPVLWFFGFVFGVINASISLIKTQNTIFTNIQSRIQSEHSICFVLSFLLFSLCFFGAETSPVLLGIFVIGRRMVLLTATNPWLFRPLQYSTVQCSLPPPRICCAS